MSNSPDGSHTRGNTGPSCSSMPPTRHTFPSRTFHTRFSKYQELESAQSSFAASQKPVVLPECGAGSRLCRNQVRALIAHYLENASILRQAAERAGLQVHGGINAPYIWVKTPAGLTSWQMFDRMLQELHVVVTPGSGFGRQGEGYIRISAFNSRANAEEVGRRLEAFSVN